MDRKVRWGILGYAGIARNHVIPAMVKAKNAEVVAIASRSREKLKEAVERFGFRKVYESYDRLLEDPEIDAVYIPLPNALHKEWPLRPQGMESMCCARSRWRLPRRTAGSWRRCLKKNG